MSRTPGQLPATSTLGALGLFNVGLFGLSFLVEVGNFWLVSGALGERGFAGYAVSLSLAMILSIFPSSWCRLDFLRNLRRSLDAAGASRGRFGAYYLLAIAGLAVCVALVVWLNEFWTTAGTMVVLLAGGASLLLAEIQAAVRVSGGYRLAPSLDLLARACFMISLLVQTPTLGSAVLFFGLSRLLAAGVGLFFLPWTHLLPAAPSLGSLGEVVVGYRYIFLANVADYAIFWADVFLLEGLAQGADVGGVFLALRIVAAAVAVVSIVGDLLLPRIIQAFQNGELGFARTALKSLAPVLTSVHASLILVGLPILSVIHPLVADHLPRNTLAYLAGCLPVLLLVPNVVVTKTVLIGHDRLRSISLGLVLAGGCKLTLVVMLLPFFGAYAVCIAMFFSYLVYAAFYYAELGRLHEGLEPVKLLPSLLLVAAAVLVGVTADLAALPTTLAAGVALGLHFAWIRKRNVVSPRDLQAVAETGIPRPGQQVLAVLAGRFDRVRGPLGDVG